MNKSLIIILAIVIFSFGNNQVFSQTTSTGKITLKDLGVESPGILPTSPFYFFKNINRGIQRFFTFNPVKKVQLELEIVNQQAAEIKKMKEIFPKRIDAITNAAQNYQNNMERLKSRLEIIKETEETGQNLDVDKLVEDLADRSIKHQRLFSELKKDFQDKSELKTILEKNQEAISEIAAKIPEKFEHQEEFKIKKENLLKKLEEIKRESEEDEEDNEEYKEDEILDNDFNKIIEFDDDNDDEKKLDSLYKELD